MHRPLVCASLIALGCAASGEASVADGSPPDAAIPDPPFQLEPLRNDAAIRADAASVVDTPAGYEVGSCPAFSVPPVGFEGAPELPFTGKVVSVAADLLVIEVPGRDPVTLYWAGVSLVGPFGVGQTVTASRLSAPYWVELRGPLTHAIFQAALGAFAFEATPGIPDGPALSFFVGCTAGDQLVYTLGTRSGADEIIIPPGATAGVGGWAVTNVISYSYRPGPAGGPGWVSIITALGQIVLP